LLTPALPGPPGEAGNDGSVPTDLAAGDGDAGPRDRGPTDPLVVATIIGLVSFVLGGGYLWWRNRASRFWPA
jgi:hypothetical protein